MQHAEKLSSWHKYFGLYDESTKTPLPIRSVRINVTINEYIAEVAYSQTYYNPYDENIETEYVFPISTAACFHNFEAKFGTTVIQGVIKEKKEASTYYEQRKQNGDVAVFAQVADDNYDNMIVKISNLPPQSEIEIKFSYIERLEVALNKFWRFTLSSFTVPLFYYQKNYNKNANNGKEFIASVLDSIPDSDILRWELKINVNSRSRMAFVQSTSHEIEISHSEISNIFSTEICLDPKNRYLPDKDFVLLYATESINKPGYLLSPFEHGYCTLLSFFPSLDYLSFNDAYRASLEGKDHLKILSAEAKREFIFIVDQSAFVNSNIFAQTKYALWHFLSELPNGSYFNIIGTGTFSGESLEKKSVSLLKAQNHISKITMNTKGVKLEDAFTQVASKKFIKDHPRVVVLLTGELASNRETDKIAQTIKDKLFKTRLFILGIGERSLTHFARRLGIEGNGTLEVVRMQSEIPEKVRHILKNALLPYFTDFELKIENDALFSYVIPLPKTLGWVSPNELIEFFIIFNHKLTEFKMTKFTLKFYNSLNNRNEEYKGQISTDCADLQEPIVKLGMLKFCEDLAKKKELYEAMGNNNMSEAFIKDVNQKLVATSLKYGILTNETAFVCVAKEGDDISRQIPTRRVVLSRKKEEEDARKYLDEEIKFQENQLNDLSVIDDSIAELSSSMLKNGAVGFENNKQLNIRSNSILSSQESKASFSSNKFRRSRRSVSQHKGITGKLYEIDIPDEPGVINRFWSWLTQLFFKKTEINQNRNQDIQSDPKFAALVELQSADGNWRLNRQLLQILDINTKTIDSTLPKSLRKNQEKEEIWITIIVLAYIGPLCKKFESMSVFEKGQRWLEMRDPNYQTHMIDAQKALGEVF